MIDLALIMSPPPPCELLELAAGQSRPASLTGQIGVDHRHGLVWLGHFGCDDRIVRVSWNASELGQDPEGRQFLAAFLSAENQLVETATLGPTYTGLSVRMTGILVEEDGIRRFVVEAAEVTATDTIRVWE